MLSYLHPHGSASPMKNWAVFQSLLVDWMYKIKSITGKGSFPFYLYLLLLCWALHYLLLKDLWGLSLLCPAHDHQPHSGPCTTDFSSRKGPLAHFSSSLTPLYCVLPSISFPKLPPSSCCSHVKDYVKSKLLHPSTEVFLVGTHLAHLILFLLILPKLCSCHAIPEPCQATPLGQSVRSAETVGYPTGLWRLRTKSCKLPH